MDEHGLTGWKVATDSAVRRNGQCDYRKKTISFSVHFVERNPESMLLDTLLHEIAHALTPGAKHGPIWSAKCREIGLNNPTRCTASDMPKGKYQAHCVQCGPLNAFRHRLTERANFQVHIACNRGRIDWKEIKQA